MFKIISIPAGASPGLAAGVVLLISSLQQSPSLLLPCCRTSMTISLLRIFFLRHNSCLSNKKRDILDNRGTDCWNWSSLWMVQNKTPNRQQSHSLIPYLKKTNKKKQADEVIHQYLQQSRDWVKQRKYSQSLTPSKPPKTGGVGTLKRVMFEYVFKRRYNCGGVYFWISGCWEHEIAEGTGVWLHQLVFFCLFFWDKELESAIADGWESYSGPSKDCSSFNSQCRGCRGYLASCCSNMNCASGRKCVAGLWSYSCDNTAEEEKAIAEEKKLAARPPRRGRGLLLQESI
jgi:hypothetical protein